MQGEQIHNNKFLPLVPKQSYKQYVEPFENFLGHEGIIKEPNFYPGSE